MEQEEEKIIWSALEYEEKERNNDWFWALGIIILTSSVTSIIFKNYFFALLLIISGLLLGFFAIKKPEVISYEINNKGIKIKERLYPFTEIKSFWVQKESLEKDKILKPLLFIKTKRLIMPTMPLPIEKDLAEKIKNKMLQAEITEEEMKEHFSEHVMEHLGF